MKKIIYIVVFLILIILLNFSVKASSIIDLCLVYEKDSYEKGDLMSISLELPKFSNLFEVIIRLEYEEESVNPIALNNEYFKLNNHSIFNDFTVNKKINNNVLYAELMKNDVEDGYYSSYKNNLCTLEFDVLSHIDDTFSFINGINISVFLFDVNHSIIEYNLKVIKQIDAGFNRDSFDVEVYSSEIELKDIFYVKNRNINEYEILEEKKVNYSVVGSYIMQIGIFDYLTGKYLSFSTIINVIDSISPIIKADKEYNIIDIDLVNIDFLDFIEVSDNYDKNINIKLNYYDKNMNKLNSEALEYFNDGDIQGEYLICLEDDKVVGFLRLNKNKIKKISYNENWNKRFDTLVGVGPLGVDPDYRKNGIAKALIFKGLIDSHNEGIKNAMIDWTGLMAIYQKYGFEVWKCYQYASKDF